jgi:AraC-like DNA-binding protein
LLALFYYNNMQHQVPREGIWHCFAFTLEGTVRRSAYAMHMLRPQAFNAARKHWTLSDVLFLECALGLLYHSQGQIRMSELAAACFLSLRQFERRFKRCIGVSPKMFARLLRFEVLLDSLIRGEAYSLADLSTRLGYHDQAHVIREFKTWTGCTPTAFLERAKMRERLRPAVLEPRAAPEPLFIVQL